MKNAIIKIDALIVMLVEELETRIAQAGTPTEEHILELERLISLTRVGAAKPVMPPKQGKVPEMSDQELVDELKKTRPPDLFPRRGPPNGKRENVSTEEVVPDEALIR